MTNRRGSTIARLVPARTPKQLFELTQEHIRPLIGLIDRLNEAGAEDELRVISNNSRGCPSGCSRFPAISNPKSRSAATSAAALTRILFRGAYVRAVSQAYLSRKLSRLPSD